MIACLFVVLLVGACGCTGAFFGTNASAGTAASATPTLPDAYTAGGPTPISGSTPVTPTPVPLNTSSAIIEGAQVNATLTEVTITCTGQSCTSGTTNGSTTAATAVNTPVSAPVSTFSSNITMAYVKENPSVAVQFSATGTNNPPYSWMWSYPGGNLSYVSDPTLVLTYNNYGYYVVSRTITNTLGTSSNSTTISICPLVASFTATPVQGQVPLTVQFVDTSTDQPVSWLWNFGDGVTNRTQNPVHTFTTSGVYTVRLDATNNLGSCWYTSTISVSPLVASFTSNQTTGPVPLIVQFTDKSTDQPTSWNWTFGDGTSSNLQNPVHTYMKNGTYTINLSAFNGYDEPISSPAIQIIAYTPFSVNLMAAPTSGMNGTSVIFTDQSTGFPSPTSWYWDFGDGYNSTQQNPSHQYVSPGLYTVAHSATNSQETLWSNKTAFISIS